MRIEDFPVEDEDRVLLAGGLLLGRVDLPWSGCRREGGRYAVIGVDIYRAKRLENAGEGHDLFGRGVRGFGGWFALGGFRGLRRWS